MNLLARLEADTGRGAAKRGIGLVMGLQCSIKMGYQVGYGSSVQCITKRPEVDYNIQW